MVICYINVVVISGEYLITREYIDRLLVILGNALLKLLRITAQSAYTDSRLSANAWTGQVDSPLISL